MDGTLGSRTARMLDGSGVESPRATTARRDRARGRRARAGRWGSTRSATPPTVPRSTLRGDRGRVAAARASSAHRARPAARPRRRCRASRASGWPPRCSSATRPRTAIWPTAIWDGRPRRVRLPVAARAGAGSANGSDAPVEELDPLLGVRPASCARSTSGPPGVPSRR